MHWSSQLCSALPRASFHMRQSRLTLLVISEEDPTARTLLLLQSGGPTAVMNASLAGALRRARNSNRFQRVLGARNGVEGILKESFVELTALTDEQLQRLRRTPSAALGTSRHRPTDAEIDQILTVCDRYEVDGLIATGGNDTADTAWRLVKASDARRSPLRVITIPKTIDNDLVGTDHCPGYGSAARFIALAVRDALFDTRAMAALYPVKIIEVMGRNAGWLTAAGALAIDAGLPRPLLCLPERPLESFEALARLVTDRLRADGLAVLVVPETLRWADGAHVAGDEPEWIDHFGHPYFPSAGIGLARRLSSVLELRARCDKPGTIARMALHAASEVDLAEAEQTGIEAVRRLVADESGVMVTIERVSDDPYRVRYGSAAVAQVANAERRMPLEMISADGNDVTAAFRDYALPLVGEPFESYLVLE
jgi:6-phosphofructokinase 1